MWRQRTLGYGQAPPSGLTMLDPNSSAAVRQLSTSHTNLSKQSIDIDRSESAATQPDAYYYPGAGTQQQPQQQQPSPFMMMLRDDTAAARRGIDMPTAHVTSAPAAAAPNHRDRFQQYLERYAPHHPETAMRRAQLLTSSATQQHFQHQEQRQQQQQQFAGDSRFPGAVLDIGGGHDGDGFGGHHAGADLVTFERASRQQNRGPYDDEPQQQPDGHQHRQQHRQQQHQQHPHARADDMIGVTGPGSNNTNNNNIVDDIEAASASVLDVRPDRLRFELCASRSEADQLRKRIGALQRMNEHLRDKLEQTQLSERESALRASTMEGHERSAGDRLADAEAEIRELKRRLGESQSSLSVTETRLAQARGRLAAFDHIASSDPNSAAAGVGSMSKSASRHDSVSELIQTLSTSHYLLSVLSVLRYMFGGAARGSPASASAAGITVHVGGGMPLMSVASHAQAVDALQALVCGNREVESEMRTRVVGWTPDDMLREVRSVVMTCETMIVRLLTEGAVGTMVRERDQQQRGLRGGRGGVSGDVAGGDGDGAGARGAPRPLHVMSLGRVEQPAPAPTANLMAYVAAQPASTAAAPPRTKVVEQQPPWRDTATDDDDVIDGGDDEEWLSPRATRTQDQSQVVSRRGGDSLSTHLDPMPMVRASQNHQQAAAQQPAPRTIQQHADVVASQSSQASLGANRRAQQPPQQQHAPDGLTRRTVAVASTTYEAEPDDAHGDGGAGWSASARALQQRDEESSERLRHFASANADDSAPPQDDPCKMQ